MTPNDTIIYRTGVCWRGTRSGEPRRLKHDITGQPWILPEIPFTAQRPAPKPQPANAVLDGDLL